MDWGRIDNTYRKNNNKSIWWATKNLLNIISGKFGILKQQIDEIRKEIKELRHSIEHTENVLKDNVARVEEKLGHTESCLQEMYDYQLDPNFIEDKLIEVEGRSRRNSLRTDGIRERPNETSGDCRNELHTLFKESLGIKEEVLTEKRVKTNKGKNDNTLKTIVCRILDYKDKIKILRNAKKLKGENIFINDEFH